jgi:hypothetical protein
MSRVKMALVIASFLTFGSGRLAAYELECEVYLACVAACPMSPCECGCREPVLVYCPVEPQVPCAAFNITSVEPLNFLSCALHLAEARLGA